MVVSKVTTKVTPFSVTPQINTSTFPEDIDTYNSEIPSRFGELNDIVDEVNATIDDINDLVFNDNGEVSLWQNEIHNATEKTIPVDADEIPVLDSASSFSLKKLTWASIKNFFVGRVTSTDNALVRFNGTSGAVQNSNATVDDSGNITANLYGNASTATKLATARTITLSSNVTGSASFDGSGNITITTTVADNSHNHTSSNISDATNLNTANMIVKRDASGNFNAGTITATFSGSGASITSLNASNLTSGTIPDARISGSYTGMTNLTGSGIVDFSQFLGNSADSVTSPSFSFTGDTNTGMYSPAADQVAITTGGVQRALFSSSGISGVGSGLTSLTGNNITWATTATAGKFDTSSTTPTASTRLNYGGYFYPTYINLIGSADTTTAPSHIFIEQNSDGFVRPQTLAQFKTNLGVVSSTDFTGTNQSLVTNGYQKLPGGLIIQWGSFTTTTATFPIVFPNSCFQVVVQLDSAASSGFASGYISTANPPADPIVSKTGITTLYSGYIRRYIAIGY